MLDLRVGGADPVSGFAAGARREWDALAIGTLLGDYDPVLVASSLSGLGVAGSDVDVVCDLRPGGFADVVVAAFGSRERFRITGRGPLTIVAFAGVRHPIEIVGEPRPVGDQQAYRHAVAHRRLVDLGGAPFAARVRRTRRTHRLKTEPAIALTLGLDGDPYDAVDRLAEASDATLAALLGRCTG